jgi:predicted metal-dependent peptidase
METAMDTEAKEEIQRVKKQRSKLFMFAPGTYMMGGDMPIEASTSIDTYATDGEKIFVNVAFSKTMTDKEVRGVLIHEIKHKAHAHHLRRPDWCPHLLWNIACDYSINGDIKQSQNYGKDFLLPEDGLVHKQHSFSGWSCERIARHLKDNDPAFADEDDQGKPQSGDGEPDGDDGEEKDSSQNPNSKSSSGGGEQSSQGQNKMPKPFGEVLDAPVKSDGDAEKIREAYQKIQEDLAEAEIVEKAMGRGAGTSLTGMALKDLTKPCPTRVIRPFLQKSFERKRSWRRPNKRFSRNGNYFPGKSRVIGELVCCIDSSGSVGWSEFQKFQSVIVNSALDLGVTKVKIAFVDSDIHMNPNTGKPWFEFQLSRSSSKSFNMDIYGGGGTTFDPIFDYIEENNEQVRALIYMTDGFGNCNISPPPYPVLWLTTHQAPWFKNGEFGQVEVLS